MEQPNAARVSAKTFRKLDRQTIQRCVEQLLLPHDAGRFGVRKITNEKIETPDPERPIQVEMPDGSQKWLVGLSGQKILLADCLNQLVSGGVNSVQTVLLYNRAGHLYGGEQINGEPVGYAFDSSTWDVAVVKLRNPDGSQRLKVLAGAMSDDESGQPLRVEHNHTRQRVIFDAAFEMINGEYRLVARNPKTPFNRVTPRDGNWIEVNDDGIAQFRHGYGGGPVMLANGDIYLDEQGRIPFVHEVVWEQRLVADGQGGVRKTPYRTVIAVTYMDATLDHALTETMPILDVYKPCGAIWSAAERPHWGPLVEGGHIDVRYQGRAVRSMLDVDMIRQAGGRLDFQMLFSAGEYYAHYGSFLAHSQGSLHTFTPVLDDRGELYDITAPLKALFTWLGRPVSFCDEQGQEFMMVHGVDRSSVPEEIALDQMLTEPAHWTHFSRNLIVFPIERDGVSVIKIKDNTGLLDLLSYWDENEMSGR